MIYIQSNKERTLAHHFDCSCALYGAIDSSLDYRLTSFEEIKSGKFDSIIKKNLFVGSVEFMNEVFNRIGLNDVRLPENSNRSFKITTIGEALEKVKNGDKIFIKPFELKLFTGFVLDNFNYPSLNSLPKDTFVMEYEVFPSKIISEWRIYVYKDMILDSKNYSGDFIVNPNYKYVLCDIANKKDQLACAYTIDIGILENGENVVIEYNDMWAIGNYGIPNDLYLKALKDRYFEIIGK